MRCGGPIVVDVIAMRVTYRKYDGSLHWNYTAVRLGEDGYGVWVGVGGDVPMYRGAEEWGLPKTPFVILMPRDAWWTASFNAEPHRTEIYCDITTVPQWPSPEEVTMIDLDLDVRRRRWGAVELLDEDEFAAHRVKYGYPPEIVAGAEASFEWLETAVRERAEPFGVASHAWLAQVT